MSAPVSLHTSQTALTLMEVLVALIILSVGLLALLKGSADNQDALIATREMTQAGMLGNNLLEEISARGLSGWNRWQGEFEPPNERYAWEFDVVPTDIASMKKGTLTIQLVDDKHPVLVLEELFFEKGQ